MPTMALTDPITYNFTDDGRIPNNPALPLVLYRGGIDLAGSPDPEAVIEKTFRGQRLGQYVAQRDIPLRPLSFDDP